MINDILKKHELELYNKKHIFYNNSDNDTLFIGFSGKVDFYVNSTWFYNNDKVKGHFLFLKNDPNFNTYTDESYKSVIQYYITKYNIKNVITYGLSMGGIASIYYGLLFKAKLIISIDPHPINYDINELYSLIDKTTFEYEKIYLNYTFYDKNTKNNIPNHTNIIIQKLLLKNVLLTIQPYISKIHLDFITSKEYLYEIINKFNMINVKKYKNKLNTIV
tara:strand:+ start:22 stop:678 length:657 start_codon:yes stop_codon:yes gene_type:complete